MVRVLKTEKDSKPEEVARQLRCPSGSKGVEVGQNMNSVNAGFNRACLEVLAIGGTDRVLEIGPGNGAFVPEMLNGQVSAKYTGLDWSSDMVSEAARINESFVENGQARFLQGSSDNLPFPDDTFDKVLAVNTLYFWDQPADHLAQIARVMRPGGRFCLAFGERSFMEGLAFTAYGFTLYDRDSASSLMKANGFRIVEAHEFRETGKSNTGEEVEKHGHILLCEI